MAEHYSRITTFMKCLLCAGPILSFFLPMLIHLILSSNNHMYLKCIFKKWARKNQPKAMVTNETNETAFQFSTALITCSGNLQSPDTLGVRVAVLICYYNPGSRWRSSSCQWQLDIRWTEGMTLKIGRQEKKIKERSWKNKSWWEKCFWQDKCERH